MNQTIDDMLTRRSVRKFKPDAVSRELIEEVIKAGTFAASGKDRQPWLIIALTNEEVKARYRDINAKFMAVNAKDPFYGAPVYIIVLANKRLTPNYVYDGTLCLGNMMLAAHALGLGSCWINRARQTFELAEWKEWLRSLGYDPEEYEGIGNLALGHPDGPLLPARPRKEGRVVWVE